MNKLSKLAFIAATAVMAASASAQSVPASRQAVNDNWVNGTGEWVWMNGTNELCWRDAFWTPATANAKCDGALVAQAPQPPVAPVAPAITSQKITYQADALFDFDKATLKPLGKQKLDELASKIQGMNTEVVVATGLHGPHRFGQVQRPSVAAPCASSQVVPGQQGCPGQQDLHGRQGQAQPGHDGLQPEEPQATDRLPRTGSPRGSGSGRYARSPEDDRSGAVSHGFRLLQSPAPAGLFRCRPSTRSSLRRSPASYILGADAPLHRPPPVARLPT